MTSTILITGASRGLGACLAERYVKAGWKVIAAQRERTDRLDALLRQCPSQIFDVALDVTDATSVAAARHRVGERYSSIDVLVNNAAVLLPEGRNPLGQMNYEAGLRVYDVNALGPLRVTEAFLPLVQLGSRKLVVNVSSEAGSIADCWRKDEYFYCMSKAALNMQTAILRNLLEPRGIDVWALHPGWMRTDMGGADADIEPMQAAEGIFELIAQRRERVAEYYFDYLGKPMRW